MPVAPTRRLRREGDRRYQGGPMKVIRNGLAGLVLLAAVVLLAPGAADAAPQASVAVSSGLVPVFDPASQTTRMLRPEAAPASILPEWTPARAAAPIPDRQ